MTKFKKILSVFTLTLAPALASLPAQAAYEIALKVGESESTVLYTYYKDNCSYGELGTIEVSNPENGVLSAIKGSTKVTTGVYCLGKTMKGWKVTLKATAKGRSCGWVAINAPDLGGSAIGSTRYSFCLTVK